MLCNFRQKFRCWVLGGGDGGLWYYDLVSKDDLLNISDQVKQNSSRTLTLEAAGGTDPVRSSHQLVTRGLRSSPSGTAVRTSSRNAPTY